MEVLVAILAAAVLLGLLLWGVRTGKTAPAGRPEAGAPVSVGEDGKVVITLDVGDVDPDAPAIGRLVDDAAFRVLASFPDAVEVEIRTPDGVVLGVRRRERPLEVRIADELYEPHMARRLAPDPSAAGRAGTEVTPGVHGEGSVTVPVRPLADRFDLPEGVQGRLGSADPEDAVALVRAILEEAGHTVEAHGDILRVGDTAVIVLRSPIGEPVDGAALNRAFRVFHDSGAPRGVVVTPGFMPPSDVRRREAFAPSLMHAGPEGIQRMADAVAVGADPLRFAAAPALR